MSLITSIVGWEVIIVVNLCHCLVTDIASKMKMDRIDLGIHIDQVL